MAHPDVSLAELAVKRLGRTRRALDALESGSMENALRAGQYLFELFTTKPNNKLLCCGNGGSAALCAHLVGELAGWFMKHRSALPAVDLTSCAAAITAIVNDTDGQFIFARQVESVAQRGDVLLAVSTSGNSRNVVNAIEYAKKLGVYTIGLLGPKGGKCASLVDLPVLTPGEDTATIQDLHEVIMHIWCDALEGLMRDDREPAVVR